MVSVKIETLIVSMPPAPSVVVLRPQGGGPAGDRVLPIWIGPTEAASIGVALEGRTRERPMTHDLLAHTISALSAKVERVVIDRVENTTFYATVYLSREGRMINVDARPSDSIALAARTSSPLFVDEDVINSSSYSYDFQNTARPKESAMSEFRSFLDSISPEDFQISDD
jgi:bifunctional DNase/RNase